jgi:hypothetical protein
MSLESYITPLIEKLSDEFRNENNRTNDPVVEWIVIAGRKEFDHAYKIKSSSGKLYAQKIYFTQVELSYHVTNALKYPKEYLWNMFTSFIDPLDVPDELKNVAQKFINTHDILNDEKQDDTIEEVRKDLLDQLFSYVLIHPLELFSLKWWNYYIANTVHHTHDVYFITNITEM